MLAIIRYSVTTGVNGIIVGRFVLSVGEVADACFLCLAPWHEIVSLELVDYLDEQKQLLFSNRCLETVEG